MPYDKNPQRHITIPNIPYVRDRLEQVLGDIAEQHDNAYLAGDYYKSDFVFTGKVLKRTAKTALDTLMMLAVGVLALPVFWINHIIRKLRRRNGNT